MTAKHSSGVPEAQQSTAKPAPNVLSATVTALTAVVVNTNLCFPCCVTLRMVLQHRVKNMCGLCVLTPIYSNAGQHPASRIVCMLMQPVEGVLSLLWYAAAGDTPLLYIAREGEHSTAQRSTALHNTA